MICGFELCRCLKISKYNHHFLQTYLQVIHTNRFLNILIHFIILSYAQDIKYTFLGIYILILNNISFLFFPNEVSFASKFLCDGNQNSSNIFLKTRCTNICMSSSVFHSPYYFPRHLLNYLPYLNINLRGRYFAKKAQKCPRRYKFYPSQISGIFKIKRF